MEAGEASTRPWRPAAAEGPAARVAGCVTLADRRPQEQVRAPEAGGQGASREPRQGRGRLTSTSSGVSGVTSGNRLNLSGSLGPCPQSGDENSAHHTGSL